MTNWIAGGGLLLLAAGLAVAASVIAGGRWLRAGLALAGLAGFIDALSNQRGLPAMLLAGLLVLFNMLALLRMRGGSGDLDTEAESFARLHLSRLSPAEAKLLIAQGSFVSAKVGEELTREGQQVDNLYFLVSGCGAVLVDHAIVGKLTPGDLIGEASLLPDGRASATVRIAEPSRLWFAEKTRLTAFLALHPRTAAELNASTMAALRDKLERANREHAEG